jgi:YD repeat-containing protein
MNRHPAARAVASTLIVTLGSLVCGAALAQIAQDTVTKFTYDAVGNVMTVIDGLNHKTTFAYDALSRRTSATDASSTGVTTFSYDGLDQMTQVRDARSVITAYSVDGLGNLVQTSSGDTGMTDNTYDESGNLTSRTDAKRQKTTYRYDALDRVTLITYHDGASVAYLYDQDTNAIGQLSKVTDASGTIQYAYDAFGRLAFETRTIGGTAYVTSYRYDAAGRMSGMTYPSGRSIGYVRDAQGRIEQITTAMASTTTPILTQVSYQPFGPVQSVTFGNGRTQARGYDLDGRIKSFTLAAQSMGVSYDAASRITAIKDAADATKGSTYGYDVLDRLTSVQAPGSSQTYVYDAVGNRTQKVNGAAVTPYTFATGSNRLVQAGSLPLVTDANGSVTGKDNATLNYDARGRMVSANTAIGLVTYTINSLGQRVRKVTPTETTVFHYDMAGKLIAESTTTGSTTKTQEYVYLGDMPVAVLK